MSECVTMFLLFPPQVLILRNQWYNEIFIIMSPSILIRNKQYFNANYVLSHRIYVALSV
jgi:hypothetical protein